MCPMQGFDHWSGELVPNGLCGAVSGRAAPRARIRSPVVSVQLGSPKKGVCSFEGRERAILYLGFPPPSRFTRRKARVCLARACYRFYASSIFLLDDPYSALDSHVAKSVHEEADSDFGVGIVYV